MKRGLSSSEEGQREEWPLQCTLPSLASFTRALVISSRGEPMWRRLWFCFGPALAGLPYHWVIEYQGRDSIPGGTG